MRSVVAELRAVVPLRPLTQIEGLRVAELQAAKLLAAMGVTQPPVPESVIASLPRVQVERHTPSPVSGVTAWVKGRWVIVLNGADSGGRQRFSLAHEFKHVLDNQIGPVLYPTSNSATTEERAEQISDYFAGCLLMPRTWVKRAWAQGIQRLPQLARLFGVSPMAMQVRLLQIGLIDPPARCSRQGRRKAGVAA